MNVTLYQCSIHGVQPTYDGTKHDVKRCIMCGGLVDAVVASRRKKEVQETNKETN